MKAVDPRVTYAELEQWPDDGRRYELYSGEVIVVPAPLPIHQVAALRLFGVLDEHARQTGGFALASPLDIVFSEHDVLQPDVVYFEPERYREIDLRKPIRVVPNLVVEVLSRSTAARDRGRKRDMFARYGVPEYWIVDPAVHTLEILRNTGGKFDQFAAFEREATVTAATIDDLIFELSALFRV